MGTRMCGECVYMPVARRGDAISQPALVSGLLCWNEMHIQLLTYLSF